MRGLRLAVTILALVALVAVSAEVQAGHSSTPQASPPQPPTPTPPPPPMGGPCTPRLAENPAVRSERAFGYPILNEGPTTTDGALPARGRIGVLIIAVDFPDAPASGDASLLAKRVMAQLDYWERASHGKLTLEATALDGFKRLPKTSAGYGNWRSPLGGGRDLVADATALVDPLVDFSRYQAVILLAPTSPESSEPSWSVFAGQGIDRDGVELRQAVFLGRSLAGPSAPYVAVHGLGRALGLPDLSSESDPYTHTPAYAAAGSWDPMSIPRPRYLLAWHQWKLGWLSAGQVACVRGRGSITDTLSPIEAASGQIEMMVAQVSPSRAYVVEARRRRGLDGDLCKEGVLVYTVDSQVAEPEAPIHVKRAALDKVARRLGCGLLYNAPFAVGRTFKDRNVSVEVLSVRPDGSYRVRLTRR